MICDKCKAAGKAHAEAEDPLTTQALRKLNKLHAKCDNTGKLSDTWCDCAHKIGYRQKESTT